MEIAIGDRVIIQTNGGESDLKIKNIVGNEIFIETEAGSADLAKIYFNQTKNSWQVQGLDFEHTVNFWRPADYVIISPLVGQEDYPYVQPLFTDPDFMKNTRWILTKSDNQIYKFLSYWETPDPNFMGWKIGYKGYVVGLAQIEKKKDDNYYFSYWLSPNYQGLGIGTAAGILIVNQFRQTNPGQPLYSEIDDNNTASIKSHQKMGFMMTDKVVYYKDKQHHVWII